MDENIFAEGEPVEAIDWLWYKPPPFTELRTESDGWYRRQFYCRNCDVSWRKRLPVTDDDYKPRCFNCGRWVKSRW